MISSSIIQREYNRFYEEIRKYMWGFQAVEALAELEISVYRLIPDLIEVRDAFEEFSLYTHDVYMDDEDFKKAMDRFSDLIYEENEPYAKLFEVREVISQ